MTTVIMDIDETLVWTRGSGKVPGSISFMDDGEQYYTVVRPSALEFLQAVSLKHNIICLTDGIVDFQEKVLEVTGLDSYIQSVYGWLDVHRTRQTMPDLFLERWVMVDNLPHDHIKMIEKASWINTTFHPGNFIYVTPFEGVVDIEPLTEIVDKIDKLML